MTELTIATHAASQIPYPDALGFLIPLLAVAAVIFFAGMIACMSFAVSSALRGSFSIMPPLVLAVVIFLPGSLWSLYNVSTISDELTANVATIQKAFAEVGYSVNRDSLALNNVGGTEQLLENPQPTIDGITTAEPGSLFYRIDDDGAIHIYSNEAQEEQSPDVTETEE